MNRLIRTCICIVFVTFHFIHCFNEKDEDKTSERRGESFLNCYLVKTRETPEKSDESIFQECIPCYAKICNMPHLL
ncbi:hypothetical protein ND861_06830 [Leptospira sp. 2 VSF19]|uniref:Lipoprotein n=1 Tax=Leptospira soteropolitanensis TaxID=2950025 RepID=A0AAW5VLQ2_9LEPT|nr:hypothetical protein [Leptospira soteropolitanensis]MCW7492367.1 hypothetical protein [Leptospira soteropolitanensis]MCW7499949.1 hypothetical protein [Leptospira soteropolitanensis]MCW7522200.1 hypothetical protein [Leptospira soteropolitanensis]MCW7526054.1 hypothetical protein [Leptospira soteropolitanensis]MCW7529832.1 hypothetical protein [Leptospira soteropolitanensis]